MAELTARQSEIMAMARQHGHVQVTEFADKFRVTPQTVRRDLNELCARGLLEREHGGAALPSGVVNFAYEARRQQAADGKRAIGAATAALIPDEASLIVNIGTTTEQVALALRHHRGIMVVTNNINVANILRDALEIEVVIAGGVVRHADGGVVGEAAVDFIRQFRVDYAVIGVSAIDADGTLLDYDFREVKVAQAIIETARKTILVADHMKFSRTAPVRVGHLEQIDVLVTDMSPPDPIVAMCAAAGVQIQIATPAASAQP